MATLESIQLRIAKLQAEAQELVAKQSTVVLDKICELMTKHGITITDIKSHTSKRRGRKSGAQAMLSKRAAGVPKYRDPKTGATWTGHGRAPGWIAAVQDRSKLLVSETSADMVPEAKKGPKAGSHVRGKQPAMYRDPRSGVTWSGRGRAPAWIASAKDRSKFLIERTAIRTTKGDTAMYAGRAVTKKMAAK